VENLPPYSKNMNLFSVLNKKEIDSLSKVLQAEENSGLYLYVKIWLKNAFRCQREFYILKLTFKKR
jgi:hypothetical protein